MSIVNSPCKNDWGGMKARKPEKIDFNTKSPSGRKIF